MTTHPLQHLAEEAGFYWSMLDTAFRLVRLRGAGAFSHQQALERELLVLGSRIPEIETLSSVEDLSATLIEKIRAALSQLTRGLHALSVNQTSFTRMRCLLEATEEVAISLAASMDFRNGEGAGAASGRLAVLLQSAEPAPTGDSSAELSRLACATAAAHLSDFVAELEYARHVAESLRLAGGAPH